MAEVIKTLHVYDCGRGHRLVTKSPLLLQHQCPTDRNFYSKIGETGVGDDETLQHAAYRATLMDFDAEKVN